MIGIIEKVVVDCLLEAGGEELKLDAFLHAGIPNDRVYRLDRHYPDEETGRLIAASLAVTGLKDSELFEVFSENFLNVVETVFPRFMVMAETSEDLVRMQAKIHALIAAGIRSPQDHHETTDKFQLEVQEHHHIVVSYRSELQLCGLYVTLVQAAARRYGDEVTIEKLSCRHTGAPVCRMDLKWTAIKGVPTPYAHPSDTPISAAG